MALLTTALVAPAGAGFYNTGARYISSSGSWLTTTNTANMELGRGRLSIRLAPAELTPNLNRCWRPRPAWATREFVHCTKFYRALGSKFGKQEWNRGGWHNPPPPAPAAILSCQCASRRACGVAARQRGRAKKRAVRQGGPDKKKTYLCDDCKAIPGRRMPRVAALCCAVQQQAGPITLAVAHSMCQLTGSSWLVSLVPPSRHVGGPPKASSHIARAMRPQMPAGEDISRGKVVDKRK